MPELSPYLLLGRKQAIKQWLKSLRARFTATARPSFMIIGAQKSGTTALARMLCEHPQLFRGQFKELHYFSNDSWYGPNTLHQYHSFFPASPPPGAKYLDATPMYLYHPEVAQRLRLYNPELKLIVLLREPASRALSAWKMCHHKFQDGPLSFLEDSRPFSDAIDEELRGNLDDFSPATAHHDYVKRGMYEKQLAKYFECFPKEQMLIINSDSLRTDPQPVINDLLSFLNVDHYDLPVRVANVGIELNQDFGENIQRLRDFYVPYNEALFQKIGASWDW